ncbi:immunoglobulin-like domain-containing protein [Aquibacillus halophilus]|uniref:immunoglobulin-like domain-containing protein n=1 Tax=Aquibacillus halophilus TaxID=930132 RepID=UPI00196A6496|nr:immunoglobulin-like domain-containing protein [Aquibacillus halophilus]
MAIVLLLVAVSLISPMSIGAATSLVPDDALRTAINEELGVADPATHEPTEAELESLTELDEADYKGITNLQGLEHATNLTLLDLNLNNVTDLSPLSGLSNLESLSLRNNDISTLAPVKNLSNLTFLNVSGNLSLDKTELSDFTQLKSLYLYSSGITDISFLENLTNLRNLYLDNNSISDITPIKDLPNLDLLNLKANSIINLSNATNLIDGLTAFNVDNQSIELAATVLNPGDTSTTTQNIVKDYNGNVIDSITPSDGGTYTSPNVEWTGLTGTETMRSYTFTQSLTNTAGETFEFSGVVEQPLNWGTSLVPDDALRAAIKAELGKSVAHVLTESDLESLTGEFKASAKGIYSIEGMQYAKNLDKLNLSLNQFSDITPLSSLTRLTSINLLSNNITDIEPLKNLYNLASLQLAVNNITDISHLDNLTSLEELYLHGNSNLNLSPLSNGFSNLKALNISSTNNSDISVLSNLSSLEYLVADDNKISDLSPIENLPLERLHVKENAITDLSQIKDLFSQLSFFYGSNQNIVLSEKNIAETTTSMYINNFIKDINEDIVDNITPSHSGVYNSPRVAWVGLNSNSDTSRSYDFSNDLSASDTHGNIEYSGTVTQPINWLFNESPVITASDRTISVGDDFDPLEGVTATDAEDGNLVNIQVTSNNVDTNTPGQYQVSYRVVDSQGGVDSLTIIVTVEGDGEPDPEPNEAPVINANDVTITVGDDYDPLANVTATDTEDGDLTDAITVTKNEVDTSAAGDYEVSYEVMDSSEKVVNATITVTVEAVPEPEPNEAPTIDADDLTITVGDDYEPLADVTATDTEDGDLTDAVVVTKNEVNTSVAGDYEVSYEVVDSGDKSAETTITVTVEAAPSRDTDEDTLPQTGEATLYLSIIGGIILILIGFVTIRRMN